MHDLIKTKSERNHQAVNGRLVRSLCSLLFFPLFQFFSRIRFTTLENNEQSRGKDQEAK